MRPLIAADLDAPLSPPRVDPCLGADIAGNGARSDFDASVSEKEVAMAKKDATAASSLPNRGAKGRYVMKILSDGARVSSSVVGRPRGARIARALSLVAALGFATITLACSSDPLPFMGSCAHITVKTGKIRSCYEFYGEDYRDDAQAQCEYFDKPQYGTTTKVLSEKCPEQGKTGHEVHDFEDEADVRMEAWFYDDGTKRNEDYVPFGDLNGDAGPK